MQASIRRMGRKRTRDKDLPQRVYQRHGAFYFVARDGTWSRLGSSKAGALRAYAELLGEAPPTFQAAAERYARTILTRKAPKTQRDQQHQLDRLVSVFGAMPLNSIRRGHIAQYRDERGATAPIGANRELALLSHLFARCLEWELCNENPCVGIERLPEAPRTRYPTDAEFLAVYEAGSPLVQVMMGLALLTGLREGDLLRLRITDLTDAGISVRTRKTGKALLIQWTDALRHACEQALSLPRSRGLTSLYLVCQPNGQPYTSAGWANAWKRHMAQCLSSGVLAERFQFRDLRAKAATDGSDPRLLGHRDPRILERHYRRLPEVVRPVR